jgi:hypothetical protein
MSQYEHESRKSPRSGWWTVALICACLAAWGLVQYVTIRDAPRQWDFGGLPDAPGQSVYSSSRPVQGAVVPPQIHPLPEASTRTAAAGAKSSLADTRPASSSTRPAEAAAPAPRGIAQSRPVSIQPGGWP